MAVSARANGGKEPDILSTERVDAFTVLSAISSPQLTGMLRMAPSPHHGFEFLIWAAYLDEEMLSKS